MEPFYVKLPPESAEEKQLIAFVESFPMTAGGKVQKYKLQELPVEMFPGPDRMPR